MARRIFYGWLIVGSGIVVTCVGVGSMLALSVYAILIREYFGARIIGTTFGAVSAISTLGMALGPWAGGWLYDTLGGYFWLYIGSFGIGLGAVAIAFTFRPPRRPAVLTSPSLAT